MCHISKDLHKISLLSLTVTTANLELPISRFQKSNRSNKKSGEAL